MGLLRPQYAELHKGTRMLVIQRGGNKLVAIYKNGKLVATQDKFTHPSDFDKCILDHGDGSEVHEQKGDFSTFAGIPESLESVSKPFKDTVVPLDTEVVKVAVKASESVTEVSKPKGKAK